MVVIEIPDDQAAALSAKAAAEGLTLEVWLGRLAAPETSTGRLAGRYRLADLMAECDPSAAPTEEDRLWLESAPVGREA